MVNYPLKNFDNVNKNQTYLYEEEPLILFSYGLEKTFCDKQNIFNVSHRVQDLLMAKFYSFSRNTIKTRGFIRSQFVNKFANKIILSTS